MLAVAVVALVAVLWWLCSSWRGAVCGRAAGLLPGVRAPLLLIAHPDDECMFFAPTILGVLQGQRPLSVLCCSTGNYYNQGETRKKELIQSCAALGIAPSDVTLIDHSDLPDSPSVKWDERLLSSLILNHIQEKNIDLVITFDEGGVSGHSNHISLYHALSSYIHLQPLILSPVVSTEHGTYIQIPPQLWKVTRRMLCFGVGICECIQEIYLHTGSTSELALRPRCSLHIIGKAVQTGEDFHHIFLLCLVVFQEAMRHHHSQLLWFRHIYLLFSRYMMINTLTFLQDKKAEKES